MIIKKTSGSLWQYYNDKPNTTITDSESFNFKARIIWKTLNDDNTK